LFSDILKTGKSIKINELLNVKIDATETIYKEKSQLEFFNAIKDLIQVKKGIF
jgi:hypothetical protein